MAKRKKSTPPSPANVARRHRNEGIGSQSQNNRREKTKKRQRPGQMRMARKDSGEMRPCRKLPGTHTQGAFLARQGRFVCTLGPRGGKKARKLERDAYPSTAPLAHRVLHYVPSSRRSTARRVNKLKKKIPETTPLFSGSPHGKASLRGRTQGKSARFQGTHRSRKRSSIQVPLRGRSNNSLSRRPLATLRTDDRVWYERASPHLYLIEE